MSLTAGAGTRCMSLLPESPTLSLEEEDEDVHRFSPAVRRDPPLLSFLFFVVSLMRKRKEKKRSGGSLNEKTRCPVPEAELDQGFENLATTLTTFPPIISFSFFISLTEGRGG